MAGESDDIGGLPKLDLPEFNLGGGLSQDIDSTGASGPRGNAERDELFAAAEADHPMDGLGGDLDFEIDTIGASGPMGNAERDELFTAAGLDPSEFNLDPTGRLEDQIDSLGASGAHGNQRLDALFAAAGVSPTTSALYDQQQEYVEDFVGRLPSRANPVAPVDGKYAQAASDIAKAVPQTASVIAAAVAAARNQGQGGQGQGQAGTVPASAPTRPRQPAGTMPPIPPASQAPQGQRPAPVPVAPQPKTTLTKAGDPAIVVLGVLGVLLGVGTIATVVVVARRRAQRAK